MGVGGYFVVVVTRRSWAESLSEAELQTRLITAKMSLARQRRKVDKRKQKENKRVSKKEPIYHFCVSGGASQDDPATSQGTVDLVLVVKDAVLGKGRTEQIFKMAFKVGHHFMSEYLCRAE